MVSALKIPLARSLSLRKAHLPPGEQPLAGLLQTMRHPHPTVVRPQFFSVQVCWDSALWQLERTLSPPDHRYSIWSVCLESCFKSAYHRLLLRQVIGAKAAILTFRTKV